MADQPQYYRITDPLESLNIRIRLRKIFGRSANTGRTNRSSTDEKDKEGDDERNRPGHRVPACFVPGDEVDLRVKWQEKVFGPREIITMAGTFRRKKSIKQRAEVAVNRHTSKLERDHAALLEDIARGQTNPLESISEVMLFTYTDKDGFIPHSNTGRTGHLVTGDGGRFSHLEEAVLSMPRKTTAAASSGSGRYGAGGVHGDSMGPGAAGGGVSDSASRVSDTAAVIQTHMIREDRYKVMYVMAAVDVNVRDARKAAKATAENAVRGGAGSPRGVHHAMPHSHGVGAGAASGWDGVNGSGRTVRVHEQVICSIKAHQNGTLEITPGFSVEEPESGDEGAYLTDHTVKVMDKEGARLTSYRFTSPSGGVFSYTVENDAEPGGGVEEMEAWEAEEALRDHWKNASRLQAAGTQLLGAPPTNGTLAHHAFLEIVSASDFTGVDRLYVEYALSLPQSWRLLEEPGGGGRSAEGGGTKGGDAVGGRGGGGVLESDGEFAARGTSQVARQAYPLAVPVRHHQFAGKGRAYSSIPLSANRGSPCYGNITMPNILHPSSDLAPCGPARRVGSACLLSLLGLLLALGASTMFWVLFAAAVIIIMALGGGGGGGGGGEGISPVAHFGFPAEFHMVNEEEGEMAGIGECPQIFLAISSLDYLGRHRVEGYGYVSFPRQPGAHELLVTTWRPICSLRTHLQGRIRETRIGQPLAPGGMSGGRTLDLGGTRTVKEILRAVNAKRLSDEIGRRLSATADPTSLAATAVAAAASGTARNPSPAPAAAAAHVAIAASKTHQVNSGQGPHRGGTRAVYDREGGGRLDGTKPAMVKNGREEEISAKVGKLQAATDLLARVRDQLERSDQRTKAPLPVGGGMAARDMAPPR